MAVFQSAALGDKKLVDQRDDLLAGLDSLLAINDEIDE